jgi:TonB-linked SusC/RagA family outer membrane protein
MTAFMGTTTYLKITRLMKLVGAMMLLCCLHVSAGGYTQDRITLNLESADLRKVLSAIEKKSSYRFLYNQALFQNKPRVNVHVTNAEITTVLNTIFSGSGIGYEILQSKLIVLKEAPAASGRIEVEEVTVRGRVTGENAAPLPGVSVTVRGAPGGTTTDANGNYSITAPDGSATLVFSYVGYQSTEVPINNRTEINVSLLPANNQMEQVVVVGYGTQRRRDVTGSVASIRGSEIARQPVQTPTQAIQGRVAGVQIISSGQPNSLPVVRVRGTGTMLGGVNPLYVVDGIITEDIRNINNADIVSMDILKDASATAIYGMRAANGVLIITTKKGRTGRMVVSYDMNIGLREASHLVDMAGPTQYAGYLNEASRFYGNGENLIDTALLDGTSTDWFDEILRRGFYQNHNVSISGGSDKVNYFLSAGFTTEEGIVLTNKFNRFTLRSNNEYRLSEKLRLSTLLSYSRLDLDDVDLGGVFNSAYRAAPYVAAKRNGLYGNTSAAGNVGNPLLGLEMNSTNGLENRLQATTSLDYKPISWLALRSSFGTDLQFYKNRSYGYKFLNSGPENVFLVAGGNQLRQNSQLTITNIDANRWVWDNTATFTKRFGEHDFNLLAGVTAERFNFNFSSGSRQNVPANENQWYLGAGDQSTQTNNNTGDRFTRNSYIGRLNYSYSGKYLLTATIRADGTSKFPEQNRWGYFPSIGLGWNITQESFMDNQDLFSLLKLRGSWGRVGNDQIPSNQFLPLATIGLPYYFGSTFVQGIAFEQIPDENLRWEETEEIDIGVDFAFLKGKLSGELDFYNKQTRDALVLVQLPAILGDPDGTYVTNAATVENRGVELGLNWNDKISANWSYTLNGNIAFNRNQILNLNQGQPLPRGSVGGQGTTTLTANGQPIGSFYLWQVDGIFQTDAEASASGQAGARAGDLKYRDINKDGMINADDRMFSGSYQPKFLYGINGGVTYRMFDMSFNTYGTSGGKIYNGKKAARGDARDNIEADVARNRWTIDNRNTNVPRANTAELPASTYFLESGDFFRINNVTIGYTLPSAALSRFKLQSFRLFITAQNLATFTNYSGFTPELLPRDEANNPGVLSAGIEQGAYPTTRTFAFGLNVGF